MVRAARALPGTTASARRGSGEERRPRPARSTPGNPAPDPWEAERTMCLPGLPGGQPPLERSDDERPQLSGRDDVVHRPHPQRPPDVMNTVELVGHLPERLGADH